MGRIKKLIPYIFLFIIFVIWIIFILPVDFDGIWTYGFAHNIYNGLVPYNDFNMIVTPLYPFIMSLPFFIFGSNYFIFSITQVFILLIVFYLLYKILDDKAWLIVLVMFFFPHFLGTYNWLLFLFFLLILYIEKKEDKDFLIGLILGLIILTKQSVGVCMILPSLIYLKDKKKITKRFIGCIIPIIIFVVYLIFTNSFYNFFDLCIAGLFDFASENGKLFNIYVILMLILIVITLYFIIKDKKDVNNYYLLTFYSISIPLFDITHFKYCLFGFLIILLLKKFKFLEKISYKWISIIFILGITLLCFREIDFKNTPYPNDINHFEYKYLVNEDMKFIKEVNEFIKENDDKNIIFLTTNAYYFRLINDMKISKLDLINKGNWGYNGSKKLLNEVKNNKDSIFIINENELGERHQTDKNVLKYILKNGKKIKSIRFFDVYEVKE